jgi:hypothetical protein
MSPAAPNRNRGVPRVPAAGTIVYVVLVPVLVDF